MNAESRRCGEALRGQGAVLAEAVVARHFAADATLDRRYGPGGREKCLEDARFHLSFLSQAVEMDRPALFCEYVAWAKVVLASRGVDPDDLRDHLKLLQSVLHELSEPQPAARADAVLHAALLALPTAPLEVPSFLDGDAPLAELARDFVALLQRGERQAASQRLLSAVESGASLRDVYLEVIAPAQHEVGRLWQMNRISVAQEHYCTAASQMIMSQLYPRVFAGRKIDATLVATCVAGNLHEIGVRMLADLFELEGWKTYFLGSNTPTAAVLDIVSERRAQVLAISAALTFDLGAVRDLIERLRGDARLDAVRVLVGGHLFNRSPGLWREVGADGHAQSADAAIAIARQWIAETT